MVKTLQPLIHQTYHLLFVKIDCSIQTYFAPNIFFTSYLFSCIKDFFFPSMTLSSSLTMFLLSSGSLLRQIIFGVFELRMLRPLPMNQYKGITILFFSSLLLVCLLSSPLFFFEQSWCSFKIFFWRSCWKDYRAIRYSCFAFRQSLFVGTVPSYTSFNYVIKLRRWTYLWIYPWWKRSKRKRSRRRSISLLADLTI